MKFFVPLVASLACTQLTSAAIVPRSVAPAVSVRGVYVRDVPQPPMTCAGSLDAQNVCRGYIANIGHAIGFAWDHMMDEIHDAGSHLKNSVLREVSSIADRIETWGREHNPVVLLEKLEDKSEEEILKIQAVVLGELKSIRAKLQRLRRWLHAEKIAGLQKLEAIGDAFDDTITNLENGFHVRVLLAKEIFSPDAQAPPAHQARASPAFEDWMPEFGQ